MQDRPDASELLAAVRGFLEKDLVPTLDGRRRFHALVAANVLAIVERELAGDDDRLAHEWQRLATLLGHAGDPPARTDAVRAGIKEMTAVLADRIRTGDADDGPFADAVRAHVRATVTEKLAIANPRYGSAGS